MITYFVIMTINEHNNGNQGLACFSSTKCPMTHADICVYIAGISALISGNVREFYAQRSFKESLAA